jgi:hypothetical protein
MTNERDLANITRMQAASVSGERMRKQERQYLFADKCIPSPRQVSAAVLACVCKNETVEATARN